MRIRPALLLFAPFALLALGAAVAVPAVHSKKSAPATLIHEGDLLFQHIGGAQGEALRLATRSPWTHVGIAFQEDDAWMVLEAVGPVKRTPLKEWIEQGAGRYVAKRLRGERLSTEALAKLRAAAKPHMGKAYDWKFLWNDDQIYCSELVWKLYAEGLGIRLCEPKPLKEYDLGSALVQRTMQERYGSAPPLDEPMVAPSTLFECGLLEVVEER